nr:RHS repeat-associated core domain-containing protein [Ruminococcus bromii]
MAKYTYNSNNGALNTLTYGTGQKISYGYDVFGNTKSIKYNGNTAFNFYTDRNGNITRSVDSINDIQYNSVFDTTGRLVRTTANSTTAESNKKFLYSTEYGYDLNNNITKLINKTPNATITNNYTYGKDNLLTKYKMTAGYIANYTYDGLNRLTKVSVDTNSPIDTSYTYYDSAREDGNYTTNLLEAETIGGVTYEYSYDTLGNITDIYRKDGDKLKTLYNYEYDAMNQLIYVSDFESRKIYNYTYDNAGNIISEVVRNTNSNGVPISTTNNSYTYGDTNWTDKLTAYNGQVITYDAIGNPLTYRDNMAFEWENGRILKNINTSDKAIQMSYDSNGMRTQKSIDGVKTNYYYDSSNNLFALTQGSDTLFFYYDNSGEVMSVSCNGTMYFYIKDLQGDITEIVDKDGKAVAEYAYDAWGNMLTEDNGTLTIGKLNPFRYRSYVYDEETGLYYLQSRYYDPLTGRFLNADTNLNSNILGLNAYIYCYNDSVNYLDRDGFQPIWAQIICGEAKDTELYKWFVEITQKGEFPELFYIAGFVRDEKGIYHARQDCLQQYAGYNDFYDFMFNLGTQMEKQKFPFRYDGQDYILWAWKGDYLNLGAGAEMGIYYGGEPHWLVDTNLTLNMALFVEYNHRMIISFTPKEKYWWITGFNPYYQSPNIKMLKVTVRVRFDNPTMFMAFYNKHHRNPHWKFVPQWYTGVLEF